MKNKFFNPVVLWLSSFYNDDFAARNHPQFPKKGSFRYAKAMVIIIMSALNLTSSERAYLRSLANTTETIFQVGKDGITDNFIAQIDSALEKRELIKLKILNNSECAPKETAEILTSRTNSQSVQIIGGKIVLYRQAKEKDDRKIKLPKIER